MFKLWNISLCVFLAISSCDLHQSQNNDLNFNEPIIVHIRQLIKAFFSSRFIASHTVTKVQQNTQNLDSYQKATELFYPGTH